MKKFSSTLLGLLLGAALGLPLSYYAQPGLVQMKFSLPEYLGQLPRIFEGADPDYVAPVLLTCLVCALVLGALGFFIGHASTSNAERSAPQSNPQQSQ